MSFREAVAAFLAIAITGFLDVLWLKVTVVCCLNHWAFINAAGILEPVFGPLRESQGALGPTISRVWSERTWHAIQVGLGFVSMILAVAHLTSVEAEPYLIMWGVFARPAAKLVANGSSAREPEGWWQVVSTRISDVLTRFPPFQYIPNIYKAPVVLLAFSLALLWALWLGLEQIMPWFITQVSLGSTVIASDLHMVKRGSPSAASSVWAPALLSAAVTLACHIHKTWQDGQKEIANNVMQKAVVEQLTGLVKQQKAMAEQLIVFNNELPDLIAHAVAQQLKATVSPQPTACSVQYHTSNGLSVLPVPPIMTSVHTADISSEVMSVMGSMSESIEIDSVVCRKSEDQVASTPPLTTDSKISTNRCHGEECYTLDCSAKRSTGGFCSDELESPAKSTELLDRFRQDKSRNTDSLNGLSEEDDDVDRDISVGSPSNSSVWVMSPTPMCR